MMKKVGFCDGFSESDRETTINVRDRYFSDAALFKQSQLEIASKLCWSQSTLNQYLNGKNRIGEKALRKFCILFQVEPSDLSPAYKFNDSPEGRANIKVDEVKQIKEILSELISAINDKRDINTIMLQAKKACAN